MYVAYTNKEMDIGIKLLGTCDVGAFTYLLFMKCVVMAQVQSARHIPVSKRVSCTFATVPIYPLSIQFTCLHSFFTCFQQILCLCNLALGQEAVHNRVMSHEATQCARQRCSTNLRSLTGPGPLLGRGSTKIEAYYNYVTVSYPTCA